jgi:two-component system response regulator FixJ
MRFKSLRNGAVAEANALVAVVQWRQHDGVSDFAGHIHLILPDPTERAACFRALAAGGDRVVRSFARADDWLDAGADRDGSGAILLFRWHQPGRIGGAALLERIVGRADIAAFVAAEQLSIAESRAILRGGACDLLPAPLDPRVVRRVIDSALAEWHEHRLTLNRHREAEARLAVLTPRERSILDAIAAGMGNKAIARQLDLSPRTVEVHRANIMRRAGAGNVAELLRWQFIAEQVRGAAVNRVHFGA